MSVQRRTSADAIESCVQGEEKSENESDMYKVATTPVYPSPTLVVRAHSVPYTLFHSFLVPTVTMKLNLLLALPSLASALAYNPFRLPDFKPTRTSPTVQKRADTWGGAVSLGPSKSTITRAVTTLVPGAAPSTQNGELFLWPGMSNGTGDLVQTTLESWAEGNSWCGATAGQWCIRCSLFGSFGQLDGDASPVSGDMKVEILYELLSDGQTWKQTATDLGTKKQLSTFSHKSGPYMVC